jgi:hypothetical protein
MATRAIRPRVRHNQDAGHVDRPQSEGLDIEEPVYRN